MVIRAISLFACFVLAAVFVARANTFEPPPVRAIFAYFPMQVEAWRGRPDPALDKQTLEVLGADDYLTRTYMTSQSAASLFIGYWSSQRHGDTIHSPLNCLPGSGWEPLSRALLTTQVADSPGGAARPITINRYVVQRGIDRVLVLYWYQSHGRVVASEYLNKLHLVRDAIRLHRTDAALVRVIVRIDDRTGAEAAAEADGVRFIQSFFPLLPAYVPA
jgi:EpsI family protein